MLSLIKSIALYTQVINAGFGLTGAKSIGTDDGYCWQATLCKGKEKIVKVSNGGYGGPDEFDYFGLKRESASGSLTSLYSLTLVKEYLQSYLIEAEVWSRENGECTAEEFETKKAAILTEDLKVEEDVLGIFVDELRAAKEQVASLKRKLKGKIAWFEKGEEDGDSYISVALTDTPENRERLRQKYPTISVILNDLVAGL